jgi:tRNA(Ile)-lysidine synthase
MLDRTTIQRIGAADGPVVVALSGGGDSVALLHLLIEALGGSRLSVAIVDHGLRAGSAADAEHARAIANELGVAATVLTLCNVKPAQAEARRARYAALCDHARRIGGTAIVTGHTLDDQAETVLMRAAAGSPWRGLAGMAPAAPAPLWPEGRGIVLARPLLGARRSGLRAYLEKRGASWIEDPANENFAFERVRIRRRIAMLEAEGVRSERWAAIATRLRVLADAVNAGAAALISAAVRVDEDIRVAREGWRGASVVRRRALGVLIAAAAGADAAPPPEAVARLEARFLEDGYRGETLGGVALAPAAEGVRLVRDPGAVLGRRDGIPAIEALVLTPGEEAVWDGRYAVTTSDPGWRMEPAPPGPRHFRCAGPRGGAEPQIRPIVADHVAHLLATSNATTIAPTFTRL